MAGIAGGDTDVQGRPLVRGGDPAIVEVLFPSAPRNTLRGPEAALPRTRQELWDLAGIPLKLTRQEFDVTCNAAVANAGGSAVSVADFMRMRQTLRPASGAHIIS